MKKIILVICSILVLSANALAGDHNAAEVDVLAKTSLSWDGQALPDYPRGAPEITILRIKVAPGAKLPMHEHPVINAGVLLAGELTVVTENNETLHLKAGDAIVEVVEKWHYGMNEGSTPAEIVVFYAGAAGRPVTVSKRDSAPAKMSN